MAYHGLFPRRSAYLKTSRPPISVLLLTVIGFCTLYAPQPLLPVLAKAFAVEPQDAALLITVTMLPLACAPLVYGYVLEAVPARFMLMTAALVLALCQIGMALAGDWWEMILLRSMIGLALPALFTALMTYVAASASPERLRQALAWYIAATIVGGFSGRALSGLAGSLLDWRVALGMWAPGLLLMAVWTGRLRGDEKSRFGRITPRVFRAVMAQPGLPQAYLAILCIFFVFAAVLNVLPFRMADLDPGTSATGIGFAYLGYLSGLIVSLNAQRLRLSFGSEVRTYLLGLVLYGLGLWLFALSSTGGIYLAMFAFCGGMFLIHTRLSGQVNQLGGPYKGVVNGIYIAAYYFGGTIGSWLPAEVYHRAGWDLFLVSVGFVLLLAAAGLWAMFRRVR